MDGASPWPWSEDLDGPVAAAGNHRVIFENDRVRVLDTRIPAGTTAPLHTHRRATASYVISGSGFVRRDEHGETLLDTRSIDPPFAMPSILWSDMTPAHTLENIGSDDIHVIAVELKG